MMVIMLFPVGPPCPALSPPPADGFYSVDYGDGISFHSVVRYWCGTGYDIIGVPILQCGEYGWSDDPPECAGIVQHYHGDNGLCIQT